MAKKPTEPKKPSKLQEIKARPLSELKGKERKMANLQPAPAWKKGQSGNEAGKPPGTKNRATILKDLLALTMIDSNGKPVANPLNPEQKTITVEIAVGVALLKKALSGNVEAIKEIQDTMHGKMKEVQQIIPPDITKQDLDGMTDAEAEAAYDAALKG